MVCRNCLWTIVYKKVKLQIYKNDLTRNLSYSKRNKIVEYGIVEFLLESSLKKFQCKELMTWEICVEFDLTIVHIDLRTIGISFHIVWKGRCSSQYESRLHGTMYWRWFCLYIILKILELGGYSKTLKKCTHFLNCMFVCCLGLSFNPPWPIRSSIYTSKYQICN